MGSEEHRAGRGSEEGEKEESVHTLHNATVPPVVYSLSTTATAVAAAVEGEHPPRPRLTRTVEVFDPYLGKWVKVVSSVATSSSGTSSRLERALAMAETKGDQDRLDEADEMFAQLASAVGSHLEGQGGASIDAPAPAVKPYLHLSISRTTTLKQ